MGSCSGQSVSYRYDLSSPITNLDPQYTTDPDAAMVLMNVMEGLTRIRPDGSVELAAAESFYLSPDRLVYTFHLRRDRRWSNGDPVTAGDFAYALGRLFNLSVPSPYAGEFSVIKNGRAILYSNSPAAHLGVTARDDYTLEITLERPSDEFLTLLASSPALPCNRTFFSKTMGRYGLEKKLILSNGPLSVSTWNQKNLILEPNPYYPSSGMALPDMAILYNQSEDRELRLLDGKTDVGYLSYENLLIARAQGASYQEDQSTVWVLLFNQNDPFFSSEIARGAFALSVDRKGLEGLLPENLYCTDVLIPPSVRVGGMEYRAAAKSNSPISYQPAQAAEMLRSVLEEKQLDKVPKLTLHLPDVNTHTLCASTLQKIWMKDTSAFVNLAPESTASLLERYAAGDWQMILLPLSSARADADSILLPFASNSTSNYSGCNSRRFDNALEDSRLLSGSQAVAAVLLAEEILLSEYAVVPLYFETSYFVWGSDTAEIEYIPFGGGPRFFVDIIQ